MLADLAAAYFGAFLLDWNFYGLFGSPFYLITGVTWFLVVGGWISGALTPLGFWFLLEIRAKGGGRWAWRWWLGFWLAHDVIYGIQIDLDALRPGVFWFSGTPPGTVSAITLATILPIWILTSPRKAHQTSSIEPTNQI